MRVILAVLLLLVGGDLALADSIDDGIDAATAGEYSRALVLLLAGADRGDARAEFFLGIMYENGQGVAKDSTEAAHYYKLSAEQGLAAAQNNLASLYADGDGVSRDETEAMRLWWLAADQGLPIAQVNLAASYATGTHAAKDLVQAYKWSALAAAQGYPDGVELLPMIVAMMTPEEQASGERLVRAWRPATTVRS